MLYLYIAHFYLMCIYLFMVYLKTLSEPEIISVEQYYNIFMTYLLTNWHSDTNKKYRTY
jgi:hypothetical protein